MLTMKMKLEEIDFEKVGIMAGMVIMECFGVFMLICGLFDIRIF